MVRRVFILMSIAAVIALATALAWRQASRQAGTQVFAGTASLTEKGEALPEIRSKLAFSGRLVGGTYHVGVPRPGLRVLHLDRPVPDAIGLESEARFYLCACGSLVVLGHVSAVEKELDAVQQAMEATGVQVIGSVAMIAGSRPPLFQIRYQYEGTPLDVAERANAVLVIAAQPVGSIGPAAGQ